MSKIASLGPSMSNRTAMNAPFRQGWLRKRFVLHPPFHQARKLENKCGHGAHCGGLFVPCSIAPFPPQSPLPAPSHNILHRNALGTNVFEQSGKVETC